MEIKGWRYYNHAATPNHSPHITPNLLPLKDKSIWKLDGFPLLARWTEEFDCGYETGWWYVIKDTPFDMSELKAKRRYEINKGIKNFEVKRIDPKEHKEEIYQIQLKAYADYPSKYRPTVDRERLFDEIDRWEFSPVYGAFYKETGEMLGYAGLNDYGEYISYSVHKVVPEYEKLSINAAIVHGILEDQKAFLASGGYLSDGARNMLHETKFQDYLEKYFGFRKAYGKLRIQYRPLVGLAVKLLFPFKKVLYKMDGNSMVNKINGILKMEEIARL